MFYHLKNNVKENARLSTVSNGSQRTAIMNIPLLFSFDSEKISNNSAGNGKTLKLSAKNFGYDYT